MKGPPVAIEVIRSKSRKRSGPRPKYEFALEFYRGNDAEVHQFKAYPVLDAGSINYTLSSTRKPERAIEGMVRTIRKMLADDDGTPLRYQPTTYEPPTMDIEPELVQQDAEDQPEPPDDEDDDRATSDLMVGPDGEPHEPADIQKALKFESGSSRRRFAYLMDEDEELTLESDQLETVYKRLLGAAADRPTRR